MVSVKEQRTTLNDEEGVCVRKRKRERKVGLRALKFNNNPVTLLQAFLTPVSQSLSS